MKIVPKISTLHDSRLVKCRQSYFKVTIENTTIRSCDMFLENRPHTLNVSRMTYTKTAKF